MLDEITKTFVLRRLQKDILKSILPPRHECLLFCSPTSTQRLMYNGLTRGGNFQNATADALKVLINLRKLCSHPSLLKNNEYPGLPIANKDGLEDSGKVKVLGALINEIRKLTPKDKVVIVSNFTSALTMIEENILKPREISYLRLDGTTELSNRQGLVDTFNATSSDRYFAFLLSSKAGGCGLNLIGANRLIMFDPDWYVSLLLSSILCRIRVSNNAIIIKGIQRQTFKQWLASIARVRPNLAGSIECSRLEQSKKLFAKGKFKRAISQPAQ